MRILSHYFVARFLGLYLTVLAVAFLILATIELVLNFDDLTALDSARSASSMIPTTTSSAMGLSGLDDWGRAIRALWVRLASYYLADVLPIASFIATFITFAWAGRAMEIVAIQAGGIRLSRVIAPVLASAVILSLAAAVLHETLILEAEQITSGQRQQSQDEIDFEREAFWYHKGRTITNIHHADRETRTLFGVEIYERGPNGKVIRVVRSDRVRVDQQGIWHIEDASIWRFSVDDPTAAPDFAEHVSMALDLDAIGGDALLGADPSILPLEQLARYLVAAPTQSASNLRRLKIRYQERLARPWLVLAFAWLALPFGLLVNRSGHFAWPAVAGVTTLGLFFLAQSTTTALAQQALAPVEWTTWLVVGVFSLGSAFALTRQPL